MGFLDKINYSMIVNSVKYVCKRGHCELFFTNVPQVNDLRSAVTYVCMIVSK